MPPVDLNAAPGNAVGELDDADRADLLLALTPDVGPVLRVRLLERFGDARAVAAASEADH
jgi:hypothetical protein